MSNDPSACEPREYVFRTGDDELIRLGYQHRAWAAATYALWERAGFAPGHRILDLGSGPGYCSIDLAHIVGQAGRIVAVDESQRFLDHLEMKMRTEPLENVETIACDVNELDLPKGSLDGAYARWLLCFLPEPINVLKRVAAALKPGGVFAMQDYSNYAAINVWPHSPAFRLVIDAVAKNWSGHGGDPNIASRLPTLLAEADFEVRDVQSISRTGRPGSIVWGWPTSFFKNYLPILVEEGTLSEGEADDFKRDWAERTANPNAVFTTPPVLEIVAVKK
jgi:ubiquinone/menaquinone biosynthesis C-methylase UbiE